MRVLKDSGVYHTPLVYLNLKKRFDVFCAVRKTGGMNWHAMVSGDLADSDLWLLSLFDRFSRASQDKCDRLEARIFFPSDFLQAAIAVLATILRAWHADTARSSMSMRAPLPATPPALPDAGVTLSPRLLPTPAPARRG